MDVLPLAQKTNLLPLILLILPVLFLIYNHLKRIASSKSSLPPGPYPWPIIGNLLNMGKKPHIELAHLAQAHGPLLSLRLGTQLLAVGSSPAIAAEILKTHDRLLSARHVPTITPKNRPDRSDLSMVWAPVCGDEWKFLRTLCRTELFASKAIETQAPLREKKVTEMVDFLVKKENQVVKVAELVFATVFNILGTIFLSQNFIDLDDGGVVGGMKGLIWRMMELGTTPNIGDFYPILSGLDLQGLNKKAVECVEKVSAIWEVFIKQRRDGKDDGGVLRERDFLDSLLDNGFTNGQINNLLLELFTAGTDTSSSTIEWAMAELIKNPEDMNKVREELKREIKENIVRESTLPHLPHLHACVKETLRLHPPVPLLLPHRASDTCKLKDYTIPINTQVQVNVWAIGRDSTVWEDPLKFKPERFLNSELDYKGNDFRFIPFGAGRRICPGLPMADKQVHLILACLIHYFDWSLPHGMHPSQIDVNEKFGVTLQKEHPLLLIPKLRK
ncbi:putative (S)-N-methylcoclaurine 3'-hydroxylase isozyme 2 [Tasmannia lanceolata]|uniref:putative (S)-N-methylcoclaurine 3'-hydroxylase isozyme 2 n=1 Tax=Tasmannia lanceolata TaxID=3420 RepID=UPI0040642D81